MQEVQLETNKSLTINDVKIKDQLGFIDSSGFKGHFVYVGNDKQDKQIICAVSMRCVNTTPNCSYGNLVEGENMRIISDKVSLSGSCLKIKKLYKFDTRQELYRWLSED